jgi:putative sugar O-methyltransferase
MFKYPDLHAAFTELQKQSALYKPTSFWDDASRKLANEFEHLGIENFRRGPLALSYFVPTYGPPTLGLRKEQVDLLTQTFNSHYPDHKKGQLALNAYLSGHLNALADYRVLLAANSAPDAFGLTEFSESAVGNPIEQFSFNGKHYSRSALNYLLGLSLLKQHTDLSNINTVLEIGGGFGTLGEILGKAPKKGLKYIDVDIPPTHFAAEYYLKSVFDKNKVASFADLKDQSTINISNLPDFTVMCSWQLEKLQGEVDLFVNFISFQEMEPSVVKNYLNHISRLSARWLLLRNMREGKQKRTSSSPGVQDPVLGADYSRLLPDYKVICQENAPFGYRTVDGFHSDLTILARIKDK